MNKSNIALSPILASTFALAIAATLTVSCGKKKTAAQTEAPTPIQVPTEAAAPSEAPKEEAAAVPSESEEATPNALTDSRDGKAYKIAKIGEQVWMAENLNYEAESSKCYDDNPENCAKYGRLYDWETAMKACPAGWHLPTQEEWIVLINYVDKANNGEVSNSALTASFIAGGLLKAKNGWHNDGNGTDAYGFAALPSGGSYSNGKFIGIGNSGGWRSASTGISRGPFLNDNSKNIDWGIYSKTGLIGIRCLQGTVTEKAEVKSETETSDAAAEAKAAVKAGAKAAGMTKYRNE